MLIRALGVAMAVSLAGCGPVVCIRACGTNVRLLVAGTSELTSVELTDPACRGQAMINGRVATFETSCESFSIDVRTANGGRFTGTVTPTVRVRPQGCGCGEADLELAVAMP